MIFLENDEDFHTIINATVDELKDLLNNKGYSADVTEKNKKVNPLMWLISNTINMPESKSMLELIEKINILADNMISLSEANSITSYYLMATNISMNFHFNTYANITNFKLERFLNTNNLKKYINDNPKQYENMEQPFQYLSDSLITWDSDRLLFLMDNGFLNIEKNKDLLFNRLNINDVDFLIKKGLSPHKKNNHEQNFLTHLLYNSRKQDDFQELFMYCEKNLPDILKETLLFKEEKKSFFDKNILRLANLNVEDFKHLFNLTKKYEKELVIQEDDNPEKTYFFLLGALNSPEKLQYLMHKKFNFTKKIKNEEKNYYHLTIEKLIENGDVFVLKNFLSHLKNNTNANLESIYFSTDKEINNDEKSLYYELGTLFTPEEINNYLDITKLELNIDNYCITYSYTTEKYFPITQYLLKNNILKANHFSMTEDKYPEKGSIYEYLNTLEECLCLRDHNIPFHLIYLSRNIFMDEKNKNSAIALMEKEKLSKIIFSESIPKINKKRI